MQIFRIDFTSAPSKPITCAVAVFANGLPLVVIELKKPGVPARTAFQKFEELN